MKVTMFVKNSFEYDARVTKEAKTLVRAGHEVTVVALHVPGVTAEAETTGDGIEVRRVRRVTFGMDRVRRRHATLAIGAERRRAERAGEEVDADQLRRKAALGPVSTATPGDDAAVDPDAVAGGSRMGGWAASALKAVVRVVRPLLGGPARAIAGPILDRRMIAAGLDSGAAVWHAHDLNTLKVGAACKRRRRGTRLVYDSHELATQRNRMGRLHRWRASMAERRGLRSADAVILTTTTRARFVADRYGIAMPTVLRNVPEAIELQTGWDLRERLGLADDRRILLYQGSVQENRGIEQIIDALEELDDCALVVIGYGHHRPVLEDMVARRGWGDRVKFFGPIPNDELLFYTASADVGMCCIVGSSLSYRWSLPNKLFEYFMAGVPVVASDYEEMGRVVTDSGAGAVCDPEDARSIADAVRTVLADHGQRASAARRASSEYRWESEEKVLLDLYEGLLDG